METSKPMKSFKKLSLSKETVQSTRHGSELAKQSPGAQVAAGASEASEYCSGTYMCSWFLSC